MATYLALGDSYSIGEGVPAVGTWPVALAQALAGTHNAASGAFTEKNIDLGPMQRGVERDPVEPLVIATTGWSTDELLAHLDQVELTPPFDLVSVLIGVNDQYREREVAEHLPHFNVLLSRAVAYADGDPARVFVVSIPDWGVSNFAAGDARGRPVIAAAIDAYNAAQRELCQLRGIAHVDITPVSRACAGDASMFVDDGLHPSAAQYQHWLELITPVARACLEATVSD